MSTVTKRLVFFLCRRCGHEWRSPHQKTPRICPKCKSQNWLTPKPQKGAA